jgi:hypothetical protein
MPLSCITALSMQNLLSFFKWSMISLLHVSLRRHTPSRAVPMSRYGTMKHFKGIAVYQSRTHISISSKIYLDTVFKNYGWKYITPTSLPMNPSYEFVRALDSAEPLDPSERSRLDNTRFRYRAAIGELIWLMITTRP